MKKEEKELDFSKLSFEENQRLVGFFSLLLKVDRRINPERYKKIEPNVAYNENGDKIYL